MTYEQRWILAQALKRGMPPLTETGSVDPPAPPEFSAAELSEAVRKHTREAGWWSFMGGAIVGVGGMYLVLSLPD
jgi:hypothetical protein